MTKKSILLSALALALLGACQNVADLAKSSAALTTNSSGTIPANLPSRLLVGLREDKGQTWMAGSGVPWDARYMYLTTGWANNFGYGAYDGTFALRYFQECDADQTLPTVSFYTMNQEPGGDEDAFLAKAQNPTTMNSYFSDFRLLMQVAKSFGKPVMVLIEPDGYAELEQQSSDNPNAYAAIAASGLPELQGLPNTVAGWGMAFLQLRNAAGASNVVLGMHISSWASGKDISYVSLTDPLQPEVDKVYAFLAPLGLAANQTGSTYDVLVGDPLDRDSDYYQLVEGNPNRWWDASDGASVSSASFNRYASFLQLWNAKAQKRWVLWQIPLGNSNALETCNNGQARGGYKDNRPEYFFAGDTSHLQKFAQSGVIALLFGAGASCQMTNVTDVYTDGKPFMENHAGAFLKAGGMGLDDGSAAPPTSPSDAGTPPVTPPVTAAPAFTLSASAPTSVAAGSAVQIQTTVKDTGGAASGIVIDVEIYDANGNRVYQTDFDGQIFSAGQSQSYTTAWTAPTTPGGYTVKLGAFGAGWTPTYTWDDSAAVISVAEGVADTASYSFEGSPQGWTGAGAALASVAPSTSRAFSGSESLAINLNGTAGAVNLSVREPTVTAGKTVSYHLYCPAGTNLEGVQPYSMQGQAGGWAWTGSYENGVSLTPGAWNTLILTVPTNAATPLYSLGLNLSVGAGAPTTCFLDAVGW